MQTVTAPYTAGAESLATSGAGELQRLRAVLERVMGWANWYRTDLNVNFGGIGITKTEIQGAGLGAHVTAVGLHTWSGFRQGAPRPGQFPALTSTADHWTGFAFPAAGHLSFVVGNPLSGLVQGGVESIRWHVGGMTLHHTAALRFAHSTAQQDGGQRGHVTALQIHPGLPGAGAASDDGSQNDAAYKDSLVLGHASVGLMIHGTGIVGGANRLYGLSNDGRYLETKTISGSITISHQAGQLVFGAGSSAVAIWGSRGQFSGTGFGTDGGHVVTLRAHVVQLMNASNHAVTIRVAPADINVDLNNNTSGDNNGATPNGRDRKQTFEISTFVHVFWIYHSGGTLLRGVMSPESPAVGPNLPTGFESWAYAGTYRRSSVDIAGFLAMHTAGSVALYTARQNVLANGSATTATTVDLSTLVPLQAMAVILHVSVLTTSNTNNPSITVLQGGTAATAVVRTVLRSGTIEVGPEVQENALEITIQNISQRIFYLQENSNGNQIDVKGYWLSNGGT